MIRKVGLGLFFLMLTGLVTRAYFGVGIPYTHDGENHLARFANYKIAIREGQLPPRWAPNLHNRYGYPVFNYNYPLANMLSLPFSILKFEYELTFKILSIGAVLAGLLGMWRWLPHFTTKKSYKLLGVTLYGFSPILFNTVLYRGNIGEIMVFGLLPWVLWSMHILPGQRLWWEWLRSIAIFTAWGLVHNVLFFFSLPLLAVYALGTWPRTAQAWKKCLLVWTCVGLLIAWFWIPAWFEKSLVVLDDTPLSKEAGQQTVTWTQLLFAPNTFGFSYPSRINSLGLTLGLVHTGVLLVATFLVIRSKESGRALIFWVVVLAWVLLVLQTTWSMALWEHLPVISFVQFPWRLLWLLAPLLPVILVWSLSRMGRTYQILIVLGLIWQASIIWRLHPADRLHKTNLDYDAFGQTTSTRNENLPKGFEYTNIGDWQPGPRIYPESGKVSVAKWSGSSRDYTLELTEKTLVIEPTAAYAGWETRANGLFVSYRNDDVIQGRLAFELDPGEYRVSTNFTQNTWPRQLGNSLTILGMLCLSGWVGWQFAPARRKGQDDHHPS